MWLVGLRAARDEASEDGECSAGGCLECDAVAEEEEELDEADEEEDDLRCGRRKEVDVGDDE